MNIAADESRALALLANSTEDVDVLSDIRRAGREGWSSLPDTLAEEGERLFRDRWGRDIDHEELTAGGPGSGRYPRGSGKRPQAQSRNPKGGGYAKKKSAVPPLPPKKTPSREDRAKREREAQLDPDSWRRGAVDVAVFLEVHGYMEPPTVLPTAEFDAVQGASVAIPVTRMVKDSDGWMNLPEAQYFDEFWRGVTSTGSTTETGQSLYERTVGDPADEAYAGWGIYALGTHVGSRSNAESFMASQAFKGSEHTTFDSERALLRVKIHPDARIITWDQIPEDLTMIGSAAAVTKWVVENGYDVVDLSGTEDTAAGVAVVNRAAMIVEEAA